MNVFEVEVDPGRNVLRTWFRNVVSAEAMEAQATRNEALIASMRPGFTVIADLAELERMEIDCVRHVTRLMDLFLAAGVGQVVRVIPDPSKDIGFTLLSLTHYRGRVPIRTCESRAEAETALCGSA